MSIFRNARRAEKKRAVAAAVVDVQQAARMVTAKRGAEEAVEVMIQEGILAWNDPDFAIRADFWDLFAGKRNEIEGLVTVCAPYAGNHTKAGFFRLVNMETGALLADFDPDRALRIVEE